MGYGAAEIIQGHGECFSSCGCLYPFVRASPAWTQHSSHKAAGKEKRFAEAKLLLIPGAQAPEGLAGEGDGLNSSLSSVLAGLAHLCPRPRCRGQRCPLHSLSMACHPHAACARFYGYLSLPCLAALATAIKYVLSSQHRARNVKIKGLTSGCFTPACSKHRCLFATERHKIYPNIARLPSHMAWQSDTHADYSDTFREAHLPGIMFAYI